MSGSASSLPDEARPPDPLAVRRRTAAIGLALAVLLVFGPVVSFEFLSLDDTGYVTANPSVVSGLSFANLRWALTATAAANWHPLTWISHQTDVELWGLASGGHHLTNLLLHATNALLAAALVTALTGERAIGLLVAALFALHPMRVESVAWIAERKDLLASAASLSALVAYLAWRRRLRPGVGGYLVVALFVALALAAKPMAVTLPCVMLLFDAWPLDRLRAGRAAIARAVLEKLPLFALVAADVLVTLVAQRAQAMASLAELPLAARLAGSVTAPLAYLARTFWPAGLSVLYPHPYLPGGDPPSALAIAGGAALVALFVGAALAGRLPPPVAVGGLWFLGSLVPTIGLVQVGEQATADRYSYLGHVGLALALVASVEAAIRPRFGTARARRWILAGGGLAVALSGLATARWLPAWSDSRTLYARSLAATPRSPMLLWLAGRESLATGELDRAFAEVRRAIELRPIFAEAHHTLGNVLEAQGRADRALHQYELALDIHPRYAPARLDLDRLRAAEWPRAPAP